jgi:hypothetical protein
VKLFYHRISVAPDNKEVTMAQYVARFLKNVLGNNGCEAEICQRSFDVKAASQADAVELAKLRFCETENVKDWHLHADRVQIIEADFPS